MGCLLTKCIKCFICSGCMSIDVDESELESLILNKDDNTVFSYKNYPFENIVWEGGGSNGVNYLGSYIALWNAGIIQQSKKFAGSSIGGFFATMAALSSNAEFVKDFIIRKNFNDLKDDDLGVIRDLNRLNSKFGYYQGNVLSSWSKEIIRSASGNEKLTFLELYTEFGNELHLVGCNLNIQDCMTFNKDTTPNMPIHEALETTMCVPGVFPAKRHNISSRDEEDVFIDGGLGNNYFIHAFDNPIYDKNDHIKGYISNPKTLGLKLMNLDTEKRDDKIHHKRVPIDNVCDFIGSLVTYQSTVIERLRLQLTPDYWERTITVPSSGKSITDFNITMEEKVENNIDSYNATSIQLLNWTKNKKFIKLNKEELKIIKENNIRDLNLNL